MGGRASTLIRSPSFIFYVYFCFCVGKSKRLVFVMRENKFQASLIKEIKTMFPGCMVLKNDSSYYQGIPDLLVLYKDKWAMLECKRRSSASRRPNQEYYINRLGEMSYASFVYPENKEEVLYELQQAFGIRG